MFMVGQPDPSQLPSGVDWSVEMRELLLDLEEKVVRATSIALAIDR